MKKKKLVEVEISITLDRKPTQEELTKLQKVFPQEAIYTVESWERVTKV